MKKALPYILTGVVLVAIIFLVANGRIGHAKKFDDRITFRKRDKIPYGTYVAYHNLNYIFPEASVTINSKEPGYWDSLSSYDSHQALVIICPEFNADASEMRTLIAFAQNNNNVFISAMNMSYEVNEILNCDINATEQLVSYFGALGAPDTLTVSLAKPPFASASYTYPGKQYDGYFSKIDTTTTEVLGYDKSGHPDFIHLRAGKGNIFIQLAPMVFTNYFLLHKNNLPYYENALSVMPRNTTKVAWDEYYLYKRGEKKKNDGKNWISTLLKDKSFAAAFWIFIILMLLYVLFEMRRKQQYIPVVKKPRNDSLDFVKTIGRLYHDKGDHRNLCRKMAAYFLEHVRNRYKVPTSELGERFVTLLNGKTGVPETEIKGIVYFINELDHLPSVTQTQLISFHNQLESFYKKA